MKEEGRREGRTMGGNMEGRGHYLVNSPSCWRRVCEGTAWMDDGEKGV